VRHGVLLSTGKVVPVIYCALSVSKVSGVVVEF